MVTPAQDYPLTVSAKSPNPSIEQTSQRPLRALCAAAHVETLDPTHNHREPHTEKKTAEPPSPSRSFVKRYRFVCFPPRRTTTSTFRSELRMAKILFEVDSRKRATLFAKLTEQAAKRAEFGEIGFAVEVDDNARHVCYVLLEWESLSSAHRFLASPASRELVAEWPIEEVLGAVPLYNLGEQLKGIEVKQSGV